jgi:hypothetical protein
MSELAGLSGVICALISLRCCWENNSGIKSPDRKAHVEKGENKNFVSCPRNLVANFRLMPVNWATDQASAEVRDPFLPFLRMLTSPFSSEARPLKRHRIAYQTVQIHGGYGYMEEYGICRIYRDVRALSIFAGTSEIMKLIINKNLGLSPM